MIRLPSLTQFLTCHLSTCLLCRIKAHVLAGGAPNRAIAPNEALALRLNM